MRDPCAKHGHDGVPDELLNGSAVLLDVILGPGVVELERLSNILRVCAVRSGRESDQVHEEDGDELPFLPGLPGRRERRSTAEAEPGVIGIALSAPWAD